MSVMGNAYPASGKRRQCSGSSSSVHNDPDAGWDEEVDTERTALIEENARLRGLVVQLSNLVLGNVVDHHNTSPMMPFRRPRLD